MCGPARVVGTMPLFYAKVVSGKAVFDVSRKTAMCKAATFSP